MILVVSAPDDPHVAAVCEHLEPGLCRSIDAGTFPGPLEISLGFTDGAIGSLCDEEAPIDLASLDAVWWRKPTPAGLRTRMVGLGDFILRESDDTFSGLLWLLRAQGCRVYNHPFDNYAASIKPRQMLAAQAVGLRVPPTLIGNAVDDAKRFLEANARCVVKGVSLSFAVDGDKHHSIFVREIDTDFTDRIDELVSCPVTLQRLVDAKYHLRVVAIDNEVMAFRIDTSHLPGHVIDWRTPDHTTLHHAPCCLPGAVSDKVLRLLEHLGLAYGVLDLIVDEADEIWFLEVNPNGQWLWLEHETGYSISSRMARALLGQ